MPLLLLPFLLAATPGLAGDTVIVDTGQTQNYDDQGEIGPPAPGQPFHGQDAQYDGNQPSYTLSGDGLTVYDHVTGLTWVASPDTDGDGILESPGDKLSWWDAMSHPATLNAQSFGGYDDWRLPSIKELYSLIDFSGVDPSGYTGSTSGLIPFIDTDYFAFEYGNESAGERIIDSQYWSSNEYVSTTMNGDHTVFGVNFADGRIKGYPTTPPIGIDMLSFALCCRGDSGYGDNSFTAPGDGTVTDAATGLMWTQDDSGSGMTWEDALAYAENLVFAGHDDWRLPNAKELQVILDYTRSPATHGTPAIDPVFSCSTITDEGGGQDYPFYWASTTHANWTANPGSFGVYVCFGTAFGWLPDPFQPGVWNLLDVHGAGSQRSDPKTGDPADYPHGHGPQGDVVRIYNHVRCVRDADDCDAEVYCSAKTTTSGCLPAMEFAGTPSATAANGFTISATQVEEGQFGLFFYSATGAQDVPFLGGRMCLQPPHLRTLVQNAGSAGSPPCAGILSLDLNATGISAAIGEGNQGWIQAWFRDPPDADGIGLTDAVQFTVCA